MCDDIREPASKLSDELDDGVNDSGKIDAGLVSADFNNSFDNDSEATLPRNEFSMDFLGQLLGVNLTFALNGTLNGREKLWEVRDIKRGRRSTKSGSNSRSRSRNSTGIDSGHGFRDRPAEFIGTLLYRMVSFGLAFQRSVVWYLMWDILSNSTQLLPDWPV